MKTLIIWGKCRKCEKSILQQIKTNSSFSTCSRERANVPGYQLANGQNCGQVPDCRLANGRNNELVRSWSQATLMRYTNGLLEKDGKSIDLIEIEKDLRQIKGIGDKRVEEIMAVFEKHLGV